MLFTMYIDVYFCIRSAYTGMCLFTGCNSNARVEVMQDKDEKDTRYPNRFKVVDGINSQIIEISAESLVQMNKWVEAINVVSIIISEQELT